MSSKEVVFPGSCNEEVILREQCPRMRWGAEHMELRREQGEQLHTEEEGRKSALRLCLEQLRHSGLSDACLELMPAIREC